MIAFFAISDFRFFDVKHFNFKLKKNHFVNYIWNDSEIMKQAAFRTRTKMIYLQLMTFFFSMQELCK